MSGRRVRRWALALSALGAVLLACVAVEYRFGFVTGYRVFRYPMARTPSLWLDLKDALGLQEFYSQFGQDKWVIGVVFPDVEDGFFVDIGAWDAELDSNTKALEDLGWEGICIDPFPRNWKDRSCHLFREVVYSEAGKEIEFRVAGPRGGIEDLLGRHKEKVERARTVRLETTTIGDILRRAEAPRFIDYVSIDTEGSEFEILRSFPFDEYEVGAFTIEHNFEEPKREQIRTLLERRGYELERTQVVGDWYVLRERS